MATYSELHGLRSHDNLIKQTQIAVLIAAQNLVKTGTTPTAAQTAWAASVLGNPAGEAQKALLFVLAGNSSATVAQITGASDALVQAKVDEVVPALINAKAGV